MMYCHECGAPCGLGDDEATATGDGVLCDACARAWPDRRPGAR